MIHIVFYFLFNILMIAVFTCIYYIIRNEFSHTRSGKKTDLLDQFSLATTVQSAVGLTDILPITKRSKLLVNLQQILTIGGFAVLLYYLKKDLKTNLK